MIPIYFLTHAQSCQTAGTSAKKKFGACAQAIWRRSGSAGVRALCPFVSVHLQINYKTKAQTSASYTFSLWRGCNFHFIYADRWRQTGYREPSDNYPASVYSRRPSTQKHTCRPPLTRPWRGSCDKNRRKSLLVLTGSRCCPHR